MLRPSTFRDLVSGRQRGPWASALRAVLRAAETPYAAAIAWRNRCYDHGWATVHHAGVPVVSVGNLTLGGTGKTPMVEWLARWFRQRSILVGIVSHGYGASSAEGNDEAMELAAKLPDVPHVQNPDRVAAAREAISRFGCQALILDDAFQHRRIGRNLDIVLLDALEPWGFGHVFPRGTLREPAAGLRRAHVVVLSRADMLDADQRAEIRRQAERLAPQALWVEARHAPQALLSIDGQQRPCESLCGQRLAAFCGIGNPAGFRHTLAVCGYQLADFREFPDHYAYGKSDRTELAAWAQRLDAAALLCTHKDLVKLGVARLGDRPLWALSIGLELLAGRKLLEGRLAAVAG